MTLDEEYALAALPGCGPGLEGSGLRTLSVGHYLVLSRVQSPIITAPGSMGCGDLAIARLIATRDWASAWSLIERKKAKWKIEWESRLFHASPIHRHRKWVELVKWWSYHTSGMQAWETDDKGAKLPVLHSVKRVLMGEMGMTWDDAMSLPFKAALSDCVCYSTASSSKGGLITDDERRYMRDKKKGLRSDG